MQRPAIVIAAALAALLATPASAYTMIAAGSSAGACYSYAEENRVSIDAVDECTRALGESLSARDRAATLVNRGVLLARLGLRDRAVADFDAAIQADPTLAEGHLNRGAASFERGNYTAAISYLTTGMGYTPENPALAYYTRAAANEDAGHLRAAYQDYQRAAELAPRWELPRQELRRFQVQR